MWENHNGVWFLSHSPAMLLSLLPPLLLLLNPQTHCPPSPHMRSNLSCAAKVQLGTQQKKLSPANITPQGHKAPCHRAVQVSVSQVSRAAPAQTPRDPHTPAGQLRQPPPFPGSSQRSSPIRSPERAPQLQRPSRWRMERTLHHNARLVGVFSLSGFQLVSLGAISHLAVPAGAKDELI